MLKSKHIVLGISGSIAAYKACTLIRLLVKAGAEVQVVITPAGREFVTPVTLSALTSKPVVTEFFSGRDGSWHSHVQLGLWADAMVVAPATASTIAKMANGVADNMLVTTYLSMKAPVFVAPAMDLDMYSHPSTRRNLDTLRAYGNHILEAADGELASHLVGKGRMQEPEEIAAALDHFFDAQAEEEAQPLRGRRVLMTAGPTYEPIDAVRFIGNHSTGKMGFALALECARLGAEVELVAGPVSEPFPAHPRIRRTDVTTAAEMYEAAVGLFASADAGVLCAAVADFTLPEVSKEKIKREGSGGLTLRLQPTRDIAAALGAAKREGQTLAGFALETSDGTAHATEKLRRKHLDFIVLNSLRDEGAGFGCDTNKVRIIDADGTHTDYPLKSKRLVARDIVAHLCRVMGL